MVSATDAKEILELAADAGIEVRLDGGWGIDALLGRQTRAHEDIDLFILKSDWDRFVSAMQSRGFREVGTEFTTADHTVWTDDGGRVIDLHRYELGADGLILYEGDSFPSDTFSGKGVIDGIPVSCVNPQSQVMFHQGYDHDDNDVHDVSLLCETFQIPVPDEYR